MPEDHVEDVRWFMSELADLYLEAERQTSELEEFIDGRRRSEWPLGRVFLTNQGRALDGLMRQLELRLSPHR